MSKLVGYLTMLSIVLALSSAPVMAQPAPAADHSTSEELGLKADAAGLKFVENGKIIAEAYMVVQTTVIEGVKFVAFKTAQGVVYVAESSLLGLEYLAKGAKFVIIKTAEGIKWVAVQAIEAGKIVIQGMIDFAVLVIDGVEYIAVKIGDGVVIVAKALVDAGKFIVDGVTYVAQKTKDGIVWVAQKSWNAAKIAVRWTREMWLATDIRTRLSSSLAAGSGALERDLAFFQRLATGANNSESLRKLAGAAYAACKAFNETYAPGR